MAIILTDEQRARVAEAQDVWLATVRPDAGAHLVPIWAVLVGDEIYIGTERKSQKVRNVEVHPRAAVSLTDTRDVLILEGQASIVAESVPGVMEEFQRKYDWTFTPGDGSWVLLRVVPDKILSWNTDAS
jgi:general stress protein 26